MKQLIDMIRNKPAYETYVVLDPDEQQALVEWFDENQAKLDSQGEDIEAYERLFENLMGAYLEQFNELQEALQAPPEINIKIDATIVIVIGGEPEVQRQQEFSEDDVFQIFDSVDDWLESL